ncbi:Uncharacterized protein Rs2_36736 [Raphanus sativus]|nr:Uncharacterized protein Rs2_36736 [Raphanus sativus]
MGFLTTRTTKPIVSSIQSSLQKSSFPLSSSPLRREGHLSSVQSASSPSFPSVVFSSPSRREASLSLLSSSPSLRVASPPFNRLSQLLRPHLLSLLTVLNRMKIVKNIQKLVSASKLSPVKALKFVS